MTTKGGRMNMSIEELKTVVACIELCVGIAEDNSSPSENIEFLKNIQSKMTVFVDGIEKK